jgi:hypothetical protein
MLELVVILLLLAGAALWQIRRERKQLERWRDGQRYMRKDHGGPW